MSSLSHTSVHSTRLQGGFRGIRTYAVLTAILVPGCAFALDPTHRITQYAHSAWTVRDGQLPGGVTAIAQTADGNLWVGTEFGLRRFDGQSFQLAETPEGRPLLDSPVFSMAAHPDGGIWIGTSNSVVHLANHHVKTYETMNRPPFAAPAQILVASDGKVWVGTTAFNSGGLCQIEENDLRCFSSTDPVLGKAIFSIFEDRKHDLWAAGRGGLCEWKPGTGCFHLYGPDAESESIAEDLNGRTWLADRTEGGLKCLANGRAVVYPLRGLGGKIRPASLLFDRDGGLWVGTFGQGLLHLSEGRIDTYTSGEGLSHDMVRRLFEDREGNVWVATDGGLDRFRDYSVTRITKREGLSSDTATSVSSIGGETWVATIEGLNRIQSSGIRVYDKSAGLPSNSVLTLVADGSGRILAGTLSGMAYLEEDRFVPLNVERSSPTRMIAAAQGQDDCLWISDQDRGLLHLCDRKVVDVTPWSSFNNEEAVVIEPDRRSGALWLGLSKGGVAHFKPGSAIHTFPTKGIVKDLHLAADGGLFIATDHGFSRLLKGRLDPFTKGNGLPCEAVHAMVEDDNGALWLNTECGLVRIDHEEMAAWVADPGKRIHVRVYDQSDGMHLSREANGYARRAAKSKDGRLWFATLNGVAVVDPKHLPENRLKPPVVIDRIMADRRPFGTNHATLPPLTRDLEIGYEALSFVAPEKVRYRYRLDGYDTDWKDDRGRRQAVYTNLGPKTYRFQVIACNNDGVWNNVGAAIEFSIAPAFYQTLWFQSLCAAAFLMALFAAYRLRVRVLQNRITLRYKGVLDERTRISRELHDTLLQNIAGFALQLGGLAKTVTAPDGARDHLHDLRQQAEEWLRDARQTVVDIRLPISTGESLVVELRKMGQVLTTGKPLQFHMEVKGRERDANEQVQEQLVRIAQEAIRNAVRHSFAKEIRLDVAYLRWKRVRVRIRDDGQGFNLHEGQCKQNHLGLASIRERAAKLGAELKISTAPGCGTNIEIIASLTKSKGD
ncbi:MAG TPA: two-component regulator propeller domain-containing protein [Bryobacteraceae bacterium]|nr:two-component regulator propeller domain-containing protein [Bryobacteraceae bacterium]